MGRESGFGGFQAPKRGCMGVLSPQGWDSTNSGEGRVFGIENIKNFKEIENLSAEMTRMKRGEAYFDSNY